MKKFLTILTGVGLIATSGTTGILSINQTGTSIVTEFNQVTANNNYATVYNWTDVKINHTIETKALGFDEKDNLAVDSMTTTESWNNSFKATNVLIASGYFALHPYNAGIYLDDVLLSLNEGQSSDSVKVWEFTQSNEVQGLLNYQLSSITLTVTAIHNPDNTTLLKVESYIYAKTSLSLHSCSTTAQITNIAFLSN